MFCENKTATDCDNNRDCKIINNYDTDIANNIYYYYTGTVNNHIFNTEFCKISSYIVKTATLKPRTGALLPISV